MNKRFKELRKTLDLSQEEFGKILGLSKSGISEIESGRRNVTDQHLVILKNSKDLEKPVNVEWLRTGKGEMFLPMDRETEIARLTVKLLTEESDSYRNRLAASLSKLSEEQLELLLAVAEKMIKKE